MYAQEYLAKEQHQERLSQAAHGQAAFQVAGLRKLEKRKERAERQLLNAWQRAERVWSLTDEG